MPARNGPKILVLDIETLPGLAYVWRTGKQFVTIESMHTPSRIACWAAKWVGDKRVYFGAEWEHEDWMNQLAELMFEADAVITYNGDRFDLPKVRGQAVLDGAPPLPPVKSIDLYRTVAGLGLDSGKLAWIIRELGIGRKVDTGGFSLWTAVFAGDPKAQRLMKTYNIGDIHATEKLYRYLRPYIKNHPYLSPKPNTCSACGSDRLQNRGFNYSRMFKTQRVHCQSCGHWDTGTRTKR